MTAATPARPALRGAGRYRTREAGWYRPSRNGAAVLLVHGGGGDRSGPLRHARMLARHGDGVLLYDAPTSTSSTPTSPAAAPRTGTSPTPRTRTACATTRARTSSASPDSSTGRWLTARRPAGTGPIG
jgi:hypothetical protein